MKTTLMKLKVFVLLIFVMLLSSSAIAGTIEQTNVTDLPSLSAGESIGQTFTAIDTSTIDLLSFYFLDNWVGDLGTIGIEVYSGIGYGGSLLGSESFALSAGAYEFQDFNLTSGIGIIAGNIYSLRLTPSTERWAVGKNQIVDSNGFDNGYDYIGGLAIINNYSITDDIINDLENKNNDLAFRVVSSPPVVPEPISSVLFVIGGSVLAGRRFMKKRK